MEDIKIPPRASSLIESLRDIGYSLIASIADIIDNSIAASASRIDLIFRWDGPTSCIFIVDDGQGMTPDELIDAMRPGSMSPLESRDKKDLGRFGLGLKTASFSQCRKLTVISRKNGAVSGCCWDLDHVAVTDDWLLKRLMPEQMDIIPEFSDLGDSGTLVLWENMDRIIDITRSHSTESNLYEKMDEVRRHLELVFHRYLKGEAGIKTISIFMNGEKLKPFDPFNSFHPATQRLPSEDLELLGETIHIQPYILPHHSKTSPVDYEYYSAGDYLKNQGFYVYRNARLLIYGTWFRLARKSELTKLARVKIDLPNNLDHLWGIDVRKSRANPPESIRQRLKKVIERITGGSSRIYTTRGRVLTRQGLNTFWIRKASHGKVKYVINRDHPFLKEFIDGLTDQVSSDFQDILTLIEDQFPIDTFYSDVSTSPESLAENTIENEKILNLAEMFYSNLKANGMEPGEIIKQFEMTEPFRNYSHIISDYLTSKER
jgi:hypothetical protein